ncbi:hypothetical protein ALC60_13776 [Trachymyrmex zeteki]|uniref:THAP-type domain-containing protein n=1 Tax=Mycetomoellerius zeteki TaxID=64791 RepID=A0A151WH92_9HYME|nr:hypothetical protein ALC60_13776 [Trachymyrmex zeteki]
MRACCVSGCKSSGNVPSHQFPKNVKHRIDWLQRLRLTEENENIIIKLRVCYKHFKNTDYSCCINKRRLVDTAIPSIDIDMFEIQRCVDTTKSSQQQEIQMSQPECVETIRASQQQKIDMSRQECVETIKSSQHHETIQMSQQETVIISQSEENTIKFITITI